MADQHLSEHIKWALCLQYLKKKHCQHNLIWQVELSDMEKFTMWEQMRDTQACADFQLNLFSQFISKSYYKSKIRRSDLVCAFHVFPLSLLYSRGTTPTCYIGLVIFGKSTVEFSGTLLQFLLFLHCTLWFTKHINLMLIPASGALVFPRIPTWRALAQASAIAY